MRNNFKAINEDLNLYRNQYCKGIDLLDLLEFVRFSPDYDETCEYCTLDLEFDGTKKNIETFAEDMREIKDYLESKLSNMKILNTKSTGGGSGKVLNLEYPQKDFKKFMQAMSSRKLRIRPNRNGDNIQLVADDLTLKNAYLVWLALKDGKDIQSVSLLSSSDDLPSDVKDEFGKRLQKPSENLKILCSDLQLAMILFSIFEDGYQKTLSNDFFKSNKAVGETKFFNDEQKKQRFYESITIMQSMSDMTKFLVNLGYNEVVSNKNSVESVIKQMETFDGVGIAKCVHNIQDKAAIKAEQMSDVEKANAKLKNPDIGDDELESMSKDAGIKAKQEVLKKIANTKSFSQVNSLLNDDLIQFGWVDQKDFDMNDEKSKEEFLKKKEEFEKRVFSSKPQPSNQCAARRIKLFEDLQSLPNQATPAKVFWNDQFVVAMTYSYVQNHIFGRYKPICVAGSKTEIDERCNSLSASGIFAKLRDHREKYDSEGKERYTVVDAGTKSTLETESNWCTTGAISTGKSQWEAREDMPSGYYRNYNDYGKAPYTIIMEVSNGRMYQYAGANSSKMFLFESEGMSNVNSWYKNSSDYIGNMKRFRLSYPILDFMMKKVDEEYQKLGYQNRQTNDSLFVSIKKYLDDNKLITRNNRLILRNTPNKPKEFSSSGRSDERNAHWLFRILRENNFDGLQINDFDGLVLDIVDASGFFAQKKFLNGLPPIDLKSVSVAGGQDFYNGHFGDLLGMFEDAHINGPLVLKNTNHIKDAFRMFRKMRCPSISGLDTSSIEHCDQMFEDSSGYNVTRNISFGEINLRKCQTANRMFYGCNARNISIVDGDNVVEARNMFEDCYALQKIPMLVKKDKDGKLVKALPKATFTFVGSDGVDYTEHRNGDDISKILFDGCHTLHKSKDFQEKCNQIYQVYFDGKDSSTTTVNNAEVDSRGFLVIKSKSTADSLHSQFYKYPGVDVQMKDAQYLFSGGTEIRIKTLDLSKVTDASYMFSEATIKRLDNIIGLENVKTVSRMFFKCRCLQFPELNFSGATGDFDMFYRSSASKEAGFPKIKIGPGIEVHSPSTNEASDSNYRYTLKDYVLGGYSGEYGFYSWEQTHTEARLIAWYKNLIKVSGIIMANKLNDSKVNSDNLLVVDNLSFLKKVLNKNPNALNTISCSTTEDKLIDGVYFDVDNTEKLFYGFDGTYINGDKSGKKLKFDMSNVVNANQMFYEYKGDLPELVNMNSLTCANYMFGNINSNNLPTFNPSTIRSANYMFHLSKFGQRYSDDLADFSSLEEARYMFEDSDFGNSPIDIRNFNFQSLVDSTAMFYEAKIKTNKINIPGQSICRNMFYRATIQVEGSDILDVYLPCCASIGNMFEQSTIVGQTSKVNLYAPCAHLCDCVFSHCGWLKVVGKMVIGGSASISYMFYDCQNLKLIVPIKSKFPTTTSFSSKNAFKGCPLHLVYGNNAEKIKAKNQALARNGH